MKQFPDLIKELNRTLNEIILFENLVNTTLIFLIFYLALLVFDLKPLYAVIPALIYLVVYSFIRLSFSKPVMIENKYSPLKEKLRTATDNIGLTNPVIEELEEEVAREMKNVGLSMFINPKILSYKLLVVILISFTIIFTATTNMKFLEFSKYKVPDIFDTKSLKGVGNLVATKLNTSEDIYGKTDVAKLGDKELNIRIKPVDFKANVREEGDLQTRKFEITFPNEFVVKETTAYEENIPQEQQELVKNYFKKLAE